jgi:MFS family permease
LSLEQEQGWSALRTSGAFVPYAVALLAAGRAAGPLIARFGAYPVTAAGLILGSGGLFVLALADPYAYFSGLLPGLLLLPIGMALSFGGAAVLAVAGVSSREAGLAGGVMNTAMELGPTAGLAALLTLGSSAAAFAAAGCGFAAIALLAQAMHLLPARKTTSNHQEQSL